MKEFNFSKIRKAQVYMIITTMLLCISSCAFSNFDTYADGNSVSICEFYQYSLKDMGFSKCWNVEDYMQSSIYNPNYTSVSWGVVGDTSSIVDLLDGDDSNGELKLPSSFSVSGQTYNLSDFPYFSIFYNDASSYAVYLYPRYSVNHIYSRGQGCSLDSSFLQNKVVRFTCTSTGWYGEQAFVNTGTINDGDVPIYVNPSNDKNCYCCNFEVSAIDTSFIEATGHLEQIQAGYLQYWFALNNVGAYGVSSWGNYNDYFIPNINYIADGYYNPITEETIGGSSGSTGTASNNLYFDYCDISYSCTGNTNGNIVCQAKLNEYQKEHLDEFLVVYNFTFDVKGYQVNSQDNESSLGNKLEFSKNYSYQQTLSDFYNNSSSNVFTLKDIEQNINTTDITADGWAEGWPGSEYGNLYKLFTYMNNNLSASGDITSRLPFKYIKCTLKTTMFVTLADVNLDNLTDNNIRSGSYSETYNFVKGTSSLNSDGILNNSNPVQTNSSGSIDSNEDLASLTTQGGVSGNDMPSSSSSNGSGSGSGSYGDNNIVINNNPTFNNNSNGSGSNGSLSTSGDSPSNSGLFSTLVDFVKGDTESTSESISEMVDSDGWISVINSYYTFIPEKFWTLLFAVMGTCIGIMVVAFIISIVLRFIS